MRVSFTIPGRIGGKGRPRFSTRGGKIRAFTPAKTASTEAMVRDFASKAMDGQDPYEGPVHLEITVWQAIPASWSKKKKADALYVTGRPDLDNIAKLCSDSMNGICYGDDAQISDLIIRRRYTSSAERVEVTVTEWVLHRNTAKAAA